MRLSYPLALAALLVAITGAEPARAQTPFRPVAVVNDSAITGFDVAQRAQILSTLGYSAPADALQTEALDLLVEDKLKLQAGKQMGLTPTPESIEAGVAEFARRLNMQPDEFRALLSAHGVTDQALEDMIAAEVVWLNVVRLRFANRIEPAEGEVDAELAKLGQGTENEFRILEIGLPLEGGGRSEAETRQLADELYESLNQGGDFRQAVERYSEAPSAAQGGEVGWVTTERMPPELRQALSGLEVGGVSRPLPVSGGLSILKVIDKRSTGRETGAAPPSREEVRNRLLNQRSTRLADGLLQEMRRDALIEVR